MPARLFLGTTLTLAIAAALSTAVAASASAGDAKAGKAVFARCVACHDIKPGAKKLGPPLAGVVGRRAGAVSGFNYSPALKTSKVVWTPAAIDAFIANPKRQIPGNRMAFPGMANAADRSNLIAYLKAAPK